MQVLAARGGELERELPFGIARQLFEARVAGASGIERSHLAQGPAELAVRTLGFGQPDAAGADADELSVVHGLFWLCANLADERPLMVVVDDAHWADDPSLRWLLYLVRRLEELPVLLVIVVRAPEPGAQLQESPLAVEPAVQLLRPSPLSEAAVATLVRDGYRSDAADEFCLACHEASGGIPFFARELIAALGADEVAPTAAYADLVRELRPEAIGWSVLSRLGRLSQDAGVLAHAVAILGRSAALHDAAALAGLSLERAERAADELSGAGILAVHRPLEFVHPVVRSVIYGDIPAGERSLAHGRAARLLSEAGAEPADCAVHLLATTPATDDWVVRTLRSAAARELAPELKLPYLRRALAERPSGEATPGLLLELGEAEAAALDPDAVVHLSKALRMSPDITERVQATRGLGAALYLTGRWEEALATVRDAIVTLEGRDVESDDAVRELKLALEADLVFLSQETGRPPPRDFATLRALGGEGRTRAERDLLAALANAWPFFGGAADDCAALAELALSRMEPNEIAPIRPFYPAIWALEASDRLDRADRWLARAIDIARERGSANAVAMASLFRGTIAYKRGALDDAQEQLARALELALRDQQGWSATGGAAILAAVHLERGEIEGAARALAMAGPAADDAHDATAGMRSRASRSIDAVHRLFTGQLQFAKRRPAEALNDFLVSGRLMAEGGYDHPSYYSWRSPAALAYNALGNRNEAERLAAEDLQLARRLGAPRATGMSLCILAAIEGGVRGIALLHEAVELLAESPSRLEHGRAMVQLGAALRRANQRTEARELLRQGYALAGDSGATALAERARQELHSLGVRPRRPAVSGAHSLTPAERRVAELAADGLTNKEIAQSLYVTIKTVEAHLAKAYTKLGIGSRSHLGAALGSSNAATAP
jgi:DNA-binding CsgD family transcriptional regulator